MRRFTLVLAGSVLALGLPEHSTSQGHPSGGGIAADELLTIHSLVGGVGRSLYRAANPPVWFPDGRRLLFTGHGKVWEVGSDGEGLREARFRGSLVVPSPAGDLVGYVSGASGNPEVWVWSEQRRQSRQLTDLGFIGIKSISWAPDGGSIALSGNRHGTFDIWKVDVPSGTVSRLTDDPGYEVNPVWSPDSRAIVFARMDDRWLDRDVIEIAADGSRERVITRELDFFDYGSGSDFGETPISPDGRWVLFRSYRSGWLNYWLVSRDGGDPRPLASESRDQRSAQWAPDGRSVAFASLENGRHELRLASTEGGDVDILVAPDMGFIKDLQWSPDGREISFIMSTPVSPQELYVVDVESRSVRRLTVSMPDATAEQRLVAPEKISYQSPDGLTIHAYLYRPPGMQPGQRAPALIRVHGGPTHQYYDHFERRVQFFVSEGFVVLLPNIRGSSGYGRAFEDANNGCWGRCDLQDVLAGADFLRSLPYVDTENLGIWGRSYGAFMTMAVVAFAPGVFNAAMPYGGYGDWEYYRTHGGPSAVRLLEYELGPYPERADVYRRSSPIHYLSDAVTPTMVIEGAVRRTHFGEGTEPAHQANLAFVRELERLGKPARYRAFARWTDGDVPFPGEEDKLFRESLEFFNRYLRNPVVDATGRGAGGQPRDEP